MTSPASNPTDQPYPSKPPSASSSLPEAVAEKNPLEVGVEYVVAAEGLPPHEVLPGSHDPPPRRPLILRRRVQLPIVLFLLTCLSTWFAGATKWMPFHYLSEAVFYWMPAIRGDAIVFWYPIGIRMDFIDVRQVIYANWFHGLVYMLCVQLILFAHEMGHYLYTLVYRVRSTLPFFLPLPIAFTGTMGAVIAMEGHKANRRQIFDIGIAGPLAGLAFTIPIVWIGVRDLHLDVPPGGGLALDLPWAMRWLVDWLHPDKLGETNHIWLSQANPYFIAGWFGLIITGLNMMPVSQLDGGHITYSLWGRGAHWFARGFMVFVFAYIIFSGHTAGILMAVLVMFLGTDHPPTSDDNVPLGWVRTLLGYSSLVIPIICFTTKILVFE